MKLIKSGNIKAVISEVTENEIMKAHRQIREFYLSIPPKHIEFVEITKESLLLADSYIKEKVVGK